MLTADADTSYESSVFEDTRDHFSEAEENAAEDPNPAHDEDGSDEEEPHPPDGPPIEAVDHPPPDGDAAVLPAEPPAMEAPADPMAALRQAIVDAFGQVGRNASYPMPTFSGKKGEKPDNHILRFTDYCNHYNIELVQKSNEFVKTLTGKARTWADAVPRVGVDLPPFERAADAAPDPVAERATLRHMFITRFAPQGRTPEALYAEWQNLSFDPSKDDIEEFIDDVQKLSDKLAYGAGATLMAVKGAMPIDLQNLILPMDDLDGLKNFLIKVFDNPRMKQTYGKKEVGGGAGAPGAFSQTTVIGEQPGKGMEYFYNKLDRLEEKMGRMNLSDQGQRKPPFKPNVTPKIRRGGGPRSGGNPRYNPNNLLRP